MISAGDLRTPVAFERKELVSDGAGGSTEEWVAIAGSATWGKVVALSGDERLEAGRINATTRERVTCRYFPDLTAVDRVVIQGRAHGITFVDNWHRRNEWLIIDIAGGVAP